MGFFDNFLAPVLLAILYNAEAVYNYRNQKSEVVREDMFPLSYIVFAKQPQCFIIYKNKTKKTKLRTPSSSCLRENQCNGLSAYNI